MRPLIVLLLIFPLVSRCQNLLVNGSFEEVNICTEYKMDCAPEGWIYTVPSFIYYFKDSKGAHTGSYYVSLIAAHSLKPFYRTFVRSRLLCRLQSGKTYRLQFYIRSNHSILDSIGVYFSSQDFLFEKRPYQTIKPSLYLANAVRKPVKGDTTWQQVIFNYRAAGHETFITIGNFKKKDIVGPTGIPYERNFFVLIDDVSLTAADNNERLCADWQTARQEIYKQDERHEYLARLIRQYKKAPPQVRLPSPTITLHIDTLIVPDVLFATNSYMLNKEAARSLDAFGQKIRHYVIDSIQVHGHTDSTGTEIFNGELSWRRAMSVAAFLEKYVQTRIVTAGWASTRPVADNRTLMGRQKNRRVEVYVYKKEGY